MEKSTEKKKNQPSPRGAAEANKTDRSNAQFKDQRPQAIAQQKLQDLANNGPLMVSQQKRQASNVSDNQSKAVAQKASSPVVQRITYKEAFDQLPFPIRFDIKDWLQQAAGYDEAPYTKWDAWLKDKDYSFVEKEINKFAKANKAPKKKPVDKPLPVEKPKTLLDEIFFENKGDVNFLMNFTEWLNVRAGKSQKDWELMLEQMTKPQVLGSVKRYIERVEGEKQEESVSLEDIASGNKEMPYLPGKEIDTLLLNSKYIADYVAGKQKEGVSVNGSVVMLNDKEFQEHHWKDFYLNNKHLLADKPEYIINHLRLQQSSKIDGVDGFQSDVDGKIYMRPGKTGFRVAIHEAVHKYGGSGFEAVMGHLMNEGATDYIALLVGEQVKGGLGGENYYPGEKQLLKEVLTSLKVSDAELFKAYFTDKAGGIQEKLVNKIGPTNAILFRKAKTIVEAVKIYNEGQKKKN